MDKKRVVHIVPHSHIDLEWYWDHATAMRWTTDIFTKALDLMRRDPDFRFSQDQVALIRPFYEGLGSADRAFFREMVDEGRFGIVGGMYVQPEVAEPRGESLVRQILVGKRWLASELGADVTVGWMIDTFGQISQLPQVLAKSGFRYNAFGRDIPAGMSADDFPSDFWHESPDGSRILTHLFPETYGGPGRLSALLRRSTTRHMLVPYGCDVTRPEETSAAMIAKVRERLEELGVSEQVEQIKVSTALDYFRSVEAESDALPVLTCDFNPPLQLQDLRGLYTQRHRLKQLNRAAEEAMLAAEVACSAAMSRGRTYPKETFGRLWPNVLHVHFHDIIGGSHHDPVYRSAMQRLQGAHDEALAITRDAVRAVAESSGGDSPSGGQSLYVFNTLSETRSELCELVLDAGEEAPAVFDDAGRPVPSRLVDDGGGGRRVEFVAEDVPAVGGKSYRLAARAGEGVGGKSCGRAGETAIENDFFRVSWDPGTGGLTQIHDKRSGRDILDPSVGQGNELIAVVEGNPDAEGMLDLTDTCFRSGDYPPDAIDVERSGMHVGIVIRGPFKDCRRVQEVLLYDALPRIDFRTTLADFTGGNVFVKVSFPLKLDWPRAGIDYETAFAATARPEGYYACQNWVDCSDGAWGAALLNRGTPGYWVGDGRLEMGLLRSLADYTKYRERALDRTGGDFTRGEFAEYEHSACTALLREHGTHEFLYSLYPHEGDWRESSVVSAGRSVNAPLIAVRTQTAGEEQSLLRAPPEFAVTAIKAAESGRGLVVRGYETTGRARSVCMKLPDWVRCAAIADLLENEVRQLAVEAGSVTVHCRPHEIITLLVSGD